MTRKESFHHQEILPQRTIQLRGTLRHRLQHQKSITSEDDYNPDYADADYNGMEKDLLSSPNMTLEKTSTSQNITLEATISENTRSEYDDYEPDYDDYKPDYDDVEEETPSGNITLEKSSASRNITTKKPSKSKSTTSKDGDYESDYADANYDDMEEDLEDDSENDPMRRKVRVISSLAF
ncbi:hypothetical protein KIN20_002775 [Parelaphostrongylus tenuis]|uniref:Uncharacterized protein n=1 Tax=Parelaphostrongylus tenuis TaxID=148309 RepID=A0AAD5QDR2_PARTN|nr:hypothetical protein KIN20_002775 [Parelaphostrongylus tenuis]